MERDLWEAACMDVNHSITGRSTVGNKGGGKEMDKKNHEEVVKIETQSMKETGKN